MAYSCGFTLQVYHISLNLVFVFLFCSIEISVKRLKAQEDISRKPSHSLKVLVSSSCCVLKVDYSYIINRDLFLAEHSKGRV